LQNIRLHQPQTCGSCTVTHQISYSALSTDILWTADGRGGRPTDLHDHPKLKLGISGRWHTKIVGVLVFSVDN